MRNHHHHHHYMCIYRVETDLDSSQIIQHWIKIHVPLINNSTTDIAGFHASVKSTYMLAPVLWLGVSLICLGYRYCLLTDYYLPTEVNSHCLMHNSSH